jgi:hypothetical protein
MIALMASSAAASSTTSSNKPFTRTFEVTDHRGKSIRNPNFGITRFYEFGDRKHPGYHNHTGNRSGRLSIPFHAHQYHPIEIKVYAQMPGQVAEWRWDIMPQYWLDEAKLPNRDRAMGRYDVKGISTGVLIDQAGRVARIGHPFNHDAEAEIDRLLESK